MTVDVLGAPPRQQIASMPFEIGLELLGQRRKFEMTVHCKVPGTSGEQVAGAFEAAMKELGGSPGDAVDVVGGSTVAHVVRWFWKRMVVNLPLLDGIDAVELGASYVYRGGKSQVGGKRVQLTGHDA